MTETSTQPPPPSSGQASPTGWNTENLRDYRGLRRSRDDRKIAGVAGGLGRHLDIDPTILRVLFFVLIFFGGAGLVMYGAMWLLVPEEGTEKSVIGASDSLRNALLIGVGVVAVLLLIGDAANGYGFPWGLLVVGAVLALVLLIRDRRQPRTDVATPAAPPGAPTEPAGTDTLVTPTPDYGTPGPEFGPPTGPPSGPPAPPYAGPPAPPKPPRPRDPRRTGPLLFGPTLAMMALALGGLGIADAAGASVSGAAYAAVAVGVIGAMLVLGAFIGRAGGLIALGLVTSVALVTAAIGGPTYHGDRDQVVMPTTAASVSDAYHVPAGRIVLDLRRVSDLEALDGRQIDVSANAGQLVLKVPPRLAVVYDAHIQYAGSVTTPTTDTNIDPGIRAVRSRDGWAPTLTGQVDGSDAKALVHVDLDLKFGDIEVVQS